MVIYYLIQMSVRKLWRFIWNPVDFCIDVLIQIVPIQNDVFDIRFPRTGIITRLPSDYLRVDYSIYLMRDNYIPPRELFLFYGFVETNKSLGTNWIYTISEIGFHHTIECTRRSWIRISQHFLQTSREYIVSYSEVPSSENACRVASYIIIILIYYIIYYNIIQLTQYTTIDYNI